MDCGSPYPQLEGPNPSVGACIPNSRGHSEAWVSISLNRGAILKCGNPYTQLEEPQTENLRKKPNPPPPLFSPETPPFLTQEPQTNHETTRTLLGGFRVQKRCKSVGGFLFFFIIGAEWEIFFGKKSGSGGGGGRRNGANWVGFW